jgi:hypothetical protein
LIKQKRELLITAATIKTCGILLPERLNGTNKRDLLIELDNKSMVINKLTGQEPAMELSPDQCTLDQSFCFASEMTRSAPARD